MAIIAAQEQHVDPRLTRITEADTKRWYQQRNLRCLYLILIPTAFGVEWISGFYSSMMNSLQAVNSWTDCKHVVLRNRRIQLTVYPVRL